MGGDRWFYVGANATTLRLFKLGPKPVVTPEPGEETDTPKTEDVPTAPAGKLTVYLNFGGTTNSPWGNTTTRTPVKLYQFTGDPSSITENVDLEPAEYIVNDGYYAIVGEGTDNQGNRVMHVWGNDHNPVGTRTDQCTASFNGEKLILNTDHRRDHLFTLHGLDTGNGDGYYTIGCVGAAGKFVNQNTTPDEHIKDVQLPVTEESQNFHISYAGTPGEFYITWQVDDPDYEQEGVPTPQPGYQTVYLNFGGSTGSPWGNTTEPTAVTLYELTDDVDTLTDSNHTLKPAERIVSGGHYAIVGQGNDANGKRILHVWGDDHTPEENHTNQCTASIGSDGNLTLASDAHPRDHVFTFTSLDSGNGDGYYTIGCIGASGKYLNQTDEANTHNQLPVSTDQATFHVSYTGTPGQFYITWEVLDPTAPQETRYFGYHDEAATNGWTVTNSPYDLRLYHADQGESAAAATLVTGVDQLEDGEVYMIVGYLTGGSEASSNRARALHVDGAQTNQCQVAQHSDLGGTIQIGACGNKHLFILHQFDDGAWYIESMQTGGYIDPSGTAVGANQVPLGNDPFPFTVEDGEDSGLRFSWSNGTAAREKPASPPTMPTDPRGDDHIPTQDKTNVYLDFKGGSWGNDWPSEHYVKLYAVDENGEKELATNGLSDGGIYKIFNDEGARYMHVWGMDGHSGTGDDKTNQCSQDTCGLPHQFRFRQNQDKTWSIESVARGKYLQPNQELNADGQLPVSEDKSGSRFYIWTDEEHMAKGEYIICWELDFELTELPDAKTLPVVDGDGYPKAGQHASTEVPHTVGQPFQNNAGGSTNYRIPAFTVLDRPGWLAAAVDARYSVLGDGGGLDTLFAISKDNGATWDNHFPIWFPDSEKYGGNAATTVIDPIVIQDDSGTIWVMADVNATGGTTMNGYHWPGAGTGYVTIDGQERLALTSSWPLSTIEPQDEDDRIYFYYVGDFSGGYAPVLERAEGHAETGYYVDNCYNIYVKDEQGNYKFPTQQQVNSPYATIQQNCFYKGSVLHVYQTGYIWAASSRDYGQTWSHTILNPQIKRDQETALLVSPGEGLITSRGHIIIGFYDNRDAAHKSPNELSSFAYSTDGGVSWRRIADAPVSQECSENELIEMPNGHLRMFCRNTSGKVGYIDAIWNGSAYEWADQGGKLLGTESVCSTCNTTAVAYTKLINGQTAVMVAYPGGPGGRANGKIFTYLIGEDDESMTLIGTYQVNSGAYAYSCMDVLDNGNIGLLWEGENSRITYQEIPVTDLIGQSYTITEIPDPEEEASLQSISGSLTGKVSVVCDDGAPQEMDFTLDDETIRSLSWGGDEAMAYLKLSAKAFVDAYVAKYGQEGYTYSLTSGETIDLMLSYREGGWQLTNRQQELTVTVASEKTPVEPEPTQPEPTEPEPVEPEPSEPEPTEPKPTEPEPVEPEPSEPEPTEPKPTEPEPVEPDPSEPKPTEPKPVEPEPSEPEPTEPRPTEPVPTEPRPTEPVPTEPAPTEPVPTEPEPTEPGPTEPTPTEPVPTEPAPTEPTPTETEPTEPAPMEPAPTEPTPTQPTPAEPDTPDVPNTPNTPDTPGDGGDTTIDDNDTPLAPGPDAGNAGNAGNAGDGGNAGAGAGAGAGNGAGAGAGAGAGNGAGAGAGNGAGAANANAGNNGDDNAVIDDNDTPLAGQPAGGNGGDTDGDAVIDENETPLAGTPGDVTEIGENETPKAETTVLNCTILPLILSLIVLAAAVIFSIYQKRRQESEFAKRW